MLPLILPKILKIKLQRLSITQQLTAHITIEFQPLLIFCQFTERITVKLSSSLQQKLMLTNFCSQIRLSTILKLCMVISLKTKEKSLLRDSRKVNSPFLSQQMLLQEALIFQTQTQLYKLNHLRKLKLTFTELVELLEQEELVLVLLSTAKNTCHLFNKLNKKLVSNSKRLVFHNLKM